MGLVQAWSRTAAIERLDLENDLEDDLDLVDLDLVDLDLDLVDLDLVDLDLDLVDLDLVDLDLDLVDLDLDLEGDGRPLGLELGDRDL